MKINKTINLRFVLILVISIFINNCMLSVLTEDQFIEGRNIQRNSIDLTTEDFESGNLTANPWVVFGYNDYLPIVQTYQKYSGNYALSLGYNYQTSQSDQLNSVALNIYCLSETKMTFFYKIDNNTNKLSIYDNDILSYATYNINWTSKTIILSKGDHKIKFQYYNDYNGYIYLDKITFSQTVKAYKEKKEDK